MSVTPEFKEASSRAAIRALRGLEQTAVMLEKWGPEAFPENEQGQVHFGRAMTDSAAQAIRNAWTSAIIEVEAFPDDPKNLIESHGRLRQSLLDIAVHLGKAVAEGKWERVAEAAEIARAALRSPLIDYITEANTQDLDEADHLHGGNPDDDPEARAAAPDAGA